MSTSHCDAKDTVRVMMGEEQMMAVNEADGRIVLRCWKVNNNDYAP